MADLRSALLNAGLVPERQVREADAQAWIDADVAAGKLAKQAAEKERRLEILRKPTTGPDAFRKEARKLMLMTPDASLVGELIAIAQNRGLRTKPRGGWLIANLHQVKEALLTAGADPAVRQRRVEELFSNK